MKKSTKKKPGFSRPRPICALLLIGCGGSAAPAGDLRPGRGRALSRDRAAPEQHARAPPLRQRSRMKLEPAGEPEPLDIAQDYIDRPLEELIAAREPISSEYGPSRLVQGAEDGMHQYEGLYVYLHP